MELVDMIFNSVHSGQVGIPIQRTAVPGKNKHSWVREMSMEEKRNLNDVHLNDPTEYSTDNSTADNKEDEVSYDSNKKTLLRRRRMERYRLESLQKSTKGITTGIPATME